MNRCASKRTMQPKMAAFARGIAPYEAEEALLDEDAVFQCQLDGSEHKHHAAAVRGIPDDSRHVYFAWSRDVEWVMLSDVCLKRKNEKGYACALFESHPGLCDWAYIEPEWVSMVAKLDQALSYLEQYGIFPIHGV
jgi:hypothetical protein